MKAADILLIYGTSHYIIDSFTNNKVKELYNKEDIDKMLDRIKDLIEIYKVKGKKVVFIKENLEDEIIDKFDIIDELKDSYIEEVSDIRDIENIDKYDSILMVGLFLDIAIMKDALYMKKVYIDKNIYIDKEACLSICRATQEAAEHILDYNIVFDINSTV